MTLIPLKLPAGFKANGTDLENSNAWLDGSLVRWHGGSLRPVGGWTERVSSFGSNTIRGMHAWQDLTTNRWIAGGSYNELKVATSGGTIYDITPADLAAGDEISVLDSGYGSSLYGSGLYGYGSQSTTYAEATTWSIDNWGEYLVACSTEDGRLLEWQLNTAAKAAPLSNAPTGNLGLVVTEERFLFALGAGGNPRRVQWSDQENTALWTPAATNQAGDIELQTSGQIMQAIRARGQTLILTDVDAHVATYQGPPFVYSFQRVSGGCGAVSRMTAVAVDQGVFWMGQRGFFLFNGNSVQEIPCDVLDHVFTNMNENQKTQNWAFNNSQHGEIWWFYCSDGSTTIDKYVAYNHKENHWLIGDLARTAGVERGVFKEPILCDYSNVLHRHEFGLDYGGAPVFAETGPISLGNGDQTMHVTQLIPDENTQGEVTVTFKSRFYPNDTETSFGPYTPSNPTSVRFAGRQFRMRVNGVAEKDWRVGNMRVDAVPAGKR